MHFTDPRFDTATYEKCVFEVPTTTAPTVDRLAILQHTFDRPVEDKNIDYVFSKRGFLLLFFFLLKFENCTGGTRKSHFPISPRYTMTEIRFYAGGAKLLLKTP